MAKPDKVKVLMLGWEYPPFFNGGLGVACEGLSHALANYVDLELLVPMAPPGARPEDLKVIGLNATDLSTLSHGPYPVLERYKKLAVPLDISPYADAMVLAAAPSPDPEDQQAEEPATPDTGNTTGASPVFVLSEPYGHDLHEKVLEYSQLTTEIASGQDFDLIHAHDWMTFLPGMELKQATGKPLVLHIHSLSYDRIGPEGTHGWVYELEKEAMEMADLIIPVSLYTAEIIEQYYGIPRSKLRPVHNAIEPVKPYKLPKTLPGQLVVFMGRLAQQKGPDHFLDVAFRVLEQNPDTYFVLAGHGPLETDLMCRVAERRLGDRIHFTGFLGRQEVHDLLAMADAFVMPSQSEPFGLAALEAAQFALPCILSRQSGVCEVLPEAPAVDHWDSEKMAAILNWILENPGEADRLGKQLQDRVSHMNWDHIAHTIAGLYQSLS